MLRTAFVVGVAGLSLLGRDPGCGGVDTSSSGVNAPCERTSDCSRGLTCAGGVCVGPDDDAGGDSGASDAGSTERDG